MNADRPESGGRAAVRRSTASLVLASLGVFAVAATTVFGTRLYEAFPVPTTLVVLCIVALLALIPRTVGMRRRDVLRSVVPVAVFSAVSVVVYAITAARFGASHATWASVMLIPLAWMAASVLGALSQPLGRTPLVWAAGTSVTLSMLAAGLDIGYRAGLVTGLNRAYELWGTSLAVWQPAAGEAYRSVGFDVDPNTFGLVGVAVFVVALAVPSRPWVRGLLAAGAAAVVALSGSRTDDAALVFAGVTYLSFLAVSDRPRSERVRELIPVGIGVLSAFVGATLIVALALGSFGSMTRVGESAADIAGANTSGTSAAQAVDESLSGRLAIWEKALSAYQAHPLGAFLPPEVLVGRSVHNEYLERLVLGGPLMLAGLLWFLAWLFMRVRPRSAPALGPCLAVAYATAALALGPSLLPPFTTILFYAIGWGLAEMKDASAVSPHMANVES